MNQPALQDFHNFASDIANSRPDIRCFLAVGNYILSLHWRNARSLVNWLSSSHPGFHDHVLEVLPRLDARCLYGK